MADLRTDTGRNRRVWLYALPLAILLEALAGGVPAAVGQVGPELPDAADGRRKPPCRRCNAAAGCRTDCAAGANPAGPPPATRWPRPRRPRWSSTCGSRAIRSLPLNKILPHIRTRAGRPFDLEMIQEDIRRLDRTPACSST